MSNFLWTAFFIIILIVSFLPREITYNYDGVIHKFSWATKSAEDDKVTK